MAEVCSGGVVEDEGGLEARAGEGVLDAGYFFAEVEAFGLRFRWVEQATGATADVGGVGKVWGVFFARAEEGEDAGFGGNGAEDFVGLRGGEVDGVFEVEEGGHRRIVVAMAA